MSVAQFLNAVLPTQGQRFVLTTFGQQGDPDFRPGQQMYPVGDTAGMIERCAWGSRNGANSYFAVAGFILGHNDKGNPSRAARFAVWHRSLRMDVDVGTGKPYATKRDALVAILGMVQHYQMPQPWLVDSGGGIHVYWAFDTDVSLQDWIPLAGRLRAACETYGLQSDHTTTIDAARVLRMPGTLNNKPAFLASGHPPTVTILQVGVSVPPAQVVQYLPAADVIYTNTTLPASLRAQQGDEFQQNLHQPYFIADMLRGCPGLLAMVGDAGARAPEPLWKATLDLINKAEDADAIKYKVARGMSLGHPKFTEEGFQQKWSQVVSQGYHPPTCGRMAAAGMTECQTCPMRGKISSPLVLGRPTYHGPSDAALPPQPAPPADPPAGAQNTPPPVANLVPVAAPSGTHFQMGVFVIDPGSSVVKVVDGRMTTHLSITDGYPTGAVQVDDPQDPNGGKKWVTKKLLEYRLIRVERLLDVGQRRSSVVLTFQRERDGEASVEFDNADFAEPKSFYKKMQGEGLYCTRKQVAEFMDRFMTEFLQQMQRARAASQIAGRCGWTDDFTGFVLGQQLYRNDGVVENIRASGVTGEMEGYHSAGDYQRWRKAFDIALAGGVDRQCVLALSLAGPLMAFTGVDGVMMNVYSPESGVGKSTLGDAAISVWGSPKVLVKNFRDTNNATYKLAATNGNMPMVIDEFTNIDGKYLSDYIYTLTQGREKHRLGADAKMANHAQRWCLAAICTSNNSVHEKLQDFRRDAEAEAARVFELRLHPLQIDLAASGQIKMDLQALRTDYGFLGPEVVKLFMAKPADYWRQQVMNRIARWDQHTANGVSDRFRSAVCALIEIGAMLGSVLGYAFDVQAIEGVLRAHWLKQVAEFEAERKAPLDFIRSYVLRHMQEFVMFGGVNGDQVINQGTLPKRFMGEFRGKSTGHYKPETIMVPMEHLREYIRENNGSYRPVMEWIKGGGAVRHGRLVYLHGMAATMTINAAEFRYDAVMGNGTQLSAVPASAGGAHVAAAS